MSFRVRSLWGPGLILGAVALLGMSCTGQDVPKPDDAAAKLKAALIPPAASPAPTANPAPATAAPPSSRCDELEARIRKFLDGLPKSISGVTGDAADQLAMETEKTTLLCGQYLAECEAHPRVGEVYYHTAKLLHLMSARRLAEWQAQFRGQANAGEISLQKRLAYMLEIARLAETAFTKLAADHALRPRALQLQGQALAEANQHDKAEFIYEKFLELFPRDEEAGAITTALCRELLELEKYDEGIKLAKKALEDFYTDKNYPSLNEFLWKLHHSKGDFDGMLEQTKRVETVYPHKLTSGKLKEGEADVYERFLDFNGFRRAYTLFVQGDFAAAKTAFQAHIEQIEKKQLALREKSKDLKPEISIYMDRSRTCLKVIEELVGLPAPAELELGNTWLTPKVVNLGEARGKVVGITFRGGGDERSAVFIGPLSQWVAKQPNMELVTVYYRKGDLPISQLQDELREEHARIGYEGAAGLDPDDVNKTVFRRFLANVGSATFIVINRRGELVWYQQDPRGVDVDFAKAVLTQWAQR